MKYKLHITTFIFALVFFTACNSNKKEDGKDTMDHSSHEMGSGSSGGSASESRFQDIMMSMEKKMMETPMTDNVDKDFASMMIEHHKGAIEMANAYLSAASNGKFSEMANTIVSAQTQEIEQLKAVREDVKTSIKDKAGSKELMNSMDMMPASGSESMNIDQQFATMMIAHHKGAIKMADIELKRGENEKLKKMAQQMKDDQKKEIDQFEDFLK